ncbi:MAG TPA: DUF814 domain-containing protein [candidate division WOR-3 bacterium]|uniref:DUF814 domain-containing protein n=1 Tax=candidate division WOR-3 bacterium TaxID=2052148 RepID=A0A7C5HFG3_UNCW3|nr:DUF814 domain-containing protein [candidate division WOR-3 bacterium]
MFSGIVIHYLLQEMKGFIGGRVRDIEINGNKLIINTGKEGIIGEIHPELQRIYIGKANGEGYFTTHFSGKRIIDIKQLGLDRFLIVEFEDEYKIVFEMLGRRGDIIIVKGDQILDSLKGKRGIYKNPEPLRALNILEESSKELRENIKSGKRITGLTPYFVRYLQELREEELDKFLEREFSPCCNEKILSPFPLPETEQTKTMNDAIVKFFHLQEEKRAKKEKEIYRRRIEKEIESLKKEIEILSKAEDYDKYKYWGDLLLTYKNSLKKVNPVKLIGFNDEPVEIPIDTAKSIKENAEGYFRLYKKMKSKEKNKTKIIEKIKKKIEKLKKRMEGVEIVGKKKGKKKIEESIPYREFILKSGNKILVGKNARGNEMVTFRIGRKFDIFFHIREAPGAHTILYLIDKNVPPGKEDIETAASIAAYFSKATHSNMVSVSFTPLRYVRKPRKGKQGLVLLTKEKNMFITPKNPKELIEEGKILES